MSVDNTTTNLGLPLPDALNKLSEDVVRLQGALNSIDTLIASLQASLAGKSDTGHTHTIANIASLQAELDAKMLASQTFALADLSDVDPSGAAADYFLIRSGASWVAAALTAAHVKSGQFAEGRMPSYLQETELDTRIATATAALVDSAPGTLDTLNELADALGDDPDFATTVTNSIATAQTAAGTAQSGVDALTAQIAELCKEEYSGYMDGELNSAPTIIPIIRNATYPRTINSLTSYLRNGSGTIRLQIEGSDVTGTTSTVNSTERTNLATANNYLDIGEDLTVVCSSLSSSDDDLHFQVNCTREFP